jgi:hypothetical protein
VFFFTNVSMTPLLMQRLQAEHQWKNWNGKGYADVLPYVQKAFSEVLSDVESALPVAYRSDLLRMIRELCEPDPAMRGHPKNRTGHFNPYSLERYISDLNALARRAEAQISRRVA